MSESPVYAYITSNTREYVVYDSNDNEVYRGKEHPFVEIFKRLEKLEQLLFWIA